MGENWNLNFEIMQMWCSDNKMLTLYTIVSMSCKCIYCYSIDCVITLFLHVSTNMF